MENPRVPIFHRRFVQACQLVENRKDDTDAIWLQKLHCYGLLQKSFQPEGEIRVLDSVLDYKCDGKKQATKAG